MLSLSSVAEGEQEEKPVGTGEAQAELSPVLVKSALFHVYEVLHHSWERFQASLKVSIVPFSILCMAPFPLLLY